MSTNLPSLEVLSILSKSFLLVEVVDFIFSLCTLSIYTNNITHFKSKFYYKYNIIKM